jgi:hypothetical protein
MFHWAQILAIEARWTKELKKKDFLVQASRQESLKKVLLLALVLVRGFFPGFQMKPSRYIFVQFGRDEIATKLCASDKDFSHAQPTAKALILGDLFLHRLDALNFLLSESRVLPRKVRKMAIWALMSMIERTIPRYSGCVFFVKHDFFSASSVIVTLSKFIDCFRVVGIQHGLMSAEGMMRRGLYPGIRTSIEFAYSDLFLKTMKTLKAAGTSVQLLGPPVDVGAAAVTMLDRLPKVVFVSSGDLRSRTRLDLIQTIGELFVSVGCDFEIRPHPSEIHFEHGLKFKSQAVEMSSDGKDTKVRAIYIGFFSTFLYQAAYKGFVTVWIETVDHEARSFLIEARSLPNALVIDQNSIDAGTVERIAKALPEAVPVSSIQSRLMSAISREAELESHAHKVRAPVGDD